MVRVHTFFEAAACVRLTDPMTDDYEQGLAFFETNLVQPSKGARNLRFVWGLIKLSLISLVHHPNSGSLAIPKLLRVPGASEQII